MLLIKLVFVLLSVYKKLIFWFVSWWHENAHNNNCSTLSFISFTGAAIGLSCADNMATAMMFLETPHALPRSDCLLTYTYGTFLSSQRSGKWRMISNGSVSAASTIKSAQPLFKALVVSLAPFLRSLKFLAWLSKSRTALPIWLSAFGQALLFSSFVPSYMNITINKYHFAIFQKKFLRPL